MSVKVIPSSRNIELSLHMVQGVSKLSHSTALIGAGGCSAVQLDSSNVDGITSREVDQ